MIYPKCHNGELTPFITSMGYLLPCCQTGGDFINTKYFIHEEFNLNKHKYNDVVNSNKWIEFINNIKYDYPATCSRSCGVEQKLPGMGFSDRKYQNKLVPTKDLNKIQIETTSRCTLSCSYCSRVNVVRSGRKHLLNKNDLSISVLEDLFYLKPWESIIDCPTYGDSIFYKHYHEMLDIMIGTDIKFYELSTAATGKTKDWWNETQLIWKTMNDNGLHVIIYWGIDGLKGSSEKHRIGQDWDEITEQMRIAAKNGIECNWQFIPFSFNEHEIDEAKKLAANWGVNFYLKPSDRFRENDHMKPNNTDYFYDVDCSDDIKVIKNEPKVELVKNTKKRYLI